MTIEKRALTPEKMRVQVDRMIRGDLPLLRELMASNPEYLSERDKEGNTKMLLYAQLAPNDQKLKILEDNGIADWTDPETGYKVVFNIVIHGDTEVKLAAMDHIDYMLMRTGKDGKGKMLVCFLLLKPDAKVYAKLNSMPELSQLPEIKAQMELIQKNAAVREKKWSKNHAVSLARKEPYRPNRFEDLDSSDGAFEK